MTANQVAYWNVEESKRHNKMTEGLTQDIQEAQKQRMATQNVTDTIQASAKMKQAEAAESQAETASRRLGMDQAYAPVDRFLKAVDIFV